MEQLLERLAQTNENLRAALVEGDAIFAEFRQGHTGERYPEQYELVPVLKGFQKIATAFAEFLRVLYEVIYDEDAIATLKRMPPESRRINYIDTQQLLPFFWTINGLNNRLYSKPLEIPYLWEQTWQLAVEYGYYGSSMTASTSLISKMSFLTGVFGRPSDSKDWDLFVEFAPLFLKKEYIDGLHLMSERASFLAIANEEDLKSSEMSWWCNLVDMTPKYEGSLYTLDSLISSCPQPTHSEAVKRLKELAVHPGVQQSIREQAQQALSAET